MINKCGVLKFIEQLLITIIKQILTGYFYMQSKVYIKHAQFKVRLKTTLFTLLLIPALFTVRSVSAGAIDFRVGSEAAELSYLTQASSFGYGGADIGFGVLFNEDNDVLGTGSILVSGSSTGDVQGLHFGVGGKAYMGVIDGPDDSLDVKGGAVSIGASLRYVFSSHTPIALLGEVYFAPEVTSISDFDRLLEYRLAVELEVTPSARAYIGYRNLEVTIDGDIDYEVDDAAHIGVRFEF